MTPEMVREECATSAEVWFFVHDLFRAPDERQWTWLESAEVIETYERLGKALRLTPFSRDDWPRNQGEYEMEFIAAFDAGAPAPLVPLLESHYNRRDPVPKILHENILFYKAFGLNLKESATESADHLRYQLEFVGYLYRLEQAGGQEDEGSDHCIQIGQARRDFLTRHLKSWLPAAAAKAAECPFGWVRNHLVLVRALVDTSTGL
jgi:DMSO reductase family type II enzyme chaperone